MLASDAGRCRSENEVVHRQGVSALEEDGHIGGAVGIDVDLDQGIGSGRYIVDLAGAGEGRAERGAIDEFQRDADVGEVDPVLIRMAERKLRKVGDRVPCCRRRAAVAGNVEVEDVAAGAADQVVPARVPLNEIVASATVDDVVAVAEVYEEPVSETDGVGCGEIPEAPVVDPNAVATTSEDDADPLAACGDTPAAADPAPRPQPSGEPGGGQRAAGA